ncbi:MAG: porin family protein [Hyphomicrobiales bacterium]|nr:porin family protein [Hyphomicrobiales bacterium]
MASVAKVLGGAVLVTMMASAYASAADMYEPAIVEHSPEQPVEFGSGWYLRGDIGVTFWNRPSVAFDTPQFVTATSVAGVDLEDTISISGGFGYRFDEYFRADMTLDYYTESDFYAAVAGNCLTGTSNCTTAEQAKLAAYVFLANVYVDLGNYAGFSPYVGAGIGAAWMEWDRATSQVTCTSACGAFATPYTTTISRDNYQGWRFAYALMAGVGYDITPDLTVDLGYRFLSIADGSIAKAGSTTGSVSYSDLYSHEVRLGLRYKID